MTPWSRRWKPSNSSPPEVIRIRALQDCSPSQALAFIFLLKNVVREELAEDFEKQNLTAELMELDSRIDGLSLLGFDVYTRRREKLCELRVNEVKNRVSGLLRKSGLSINSE
ncbi:MAG: RsbRD N-terminal domain-containing protein [Deltaproteobacteria bacterium]|nr:RsbRD N-terminal domain-containing protein [Deltaproteobacteria bacterium]